MGADHFQEVGRPRQAPGVGGQNPLGAPLHVPSSCTVVLTRLPSPARRMVRRVSSDFLPDPERSGRPPGPPARYRHRKAWIGTLSPPARQLRSPSVLLTS